MAESEPAHGRRAEDGERREVRTASPYPGDFQQHDRHAPDGWATSCLVERRKRRSRVAGKRRPSPPNRLQLAARKAMEYGLKQIEVFVRALAPGAPSARWQAAAWRSPRFVT